MDTVVEFEHSHRYMSSRELVEDLSRRFMRLHRDEDAEVRSVVDRCGKLIEVIGTRRATVDDWIVVTHERIEVEDLRPVRRRTHELRFQSFWS